MTIRWAAALLSLALFAACSTTESSAPVPTAPADAGSEEPAPADAGSAPEASNEPSLDGGCADTFGDALTEGFGRIDGVVYAVQKPSDTQCTMPNSDHVVLQVLMNGAVYRLVTNVQSTKGDPQVRYAELAHALPSPAYAEGWHTGVTLDYPTTLGVHTADFTPYAMDDLVAKIAAAVKVGAKVSVYGESGAGRPESAHNIHRDSSEHDGAIVVDPTGSPKFLLFHFADQTF